MAKLLGNINQR